VVCGGVTGNVHRLKFDTLMVKLGDLTLILKLKHGSAKHKFAMSSVG